jgi:hypothetical protein
VDGSINDMEINTNLTAGGLSNLTPPKQRSVAASQAAEAGASFASSNALEVALNGIPDVRPEAVDRARQLIADPNYPSADTIKTLAGFFADKLSTPE